MSPAFLLVLAVIALAAAVKGAIGFGFPLIAVPVLANVVDPRTAVVVMSIPTAVSNLIVMARGGASAKHLRMLAGLLLGMLPGTYLGAQLLTGLDTRWLGVLVGLIAMLFAGLGLARVEPTLSPRHSHLLAPAVGLASGVLGGTTNIFGPVVASYLHTLKLAKQDFVVCISLVFLVGGVTQVLSYYQLGLYTADSLALSVIACLPMLLGVYVGLKVQDALPARAFNLVVLAVILVSGLNLVAKGVLS